MTSIVGFMFNTLYLLALGVLTVYGVHRYWQVVLYYRKSGNKPLPAARFADWPTITVQLPLFNERFVAARVIEAACQMDYPRHLLQVQVLDDSTDDSADIARETCHKMANAGHNVEYIHRSNRQGYKAGALENGLATATGEFIAIFDADFVPQPRMLKNTIQYFTDPAVGCVQTRWEHLNRWHSLLTRCQAIFLDGHFVIEHAARSRSGRFINFNGTGGIWRKTSIASAGGWQHDTLTEDMDLSYRAQMAGWRIIFLSEETSPAELPPEIAAFKQQQHRWAKGHAQTAVKILPRLLASPLPLKVKMEALFHLSAGAAYPLAVLLSILVFPTFYFGGPSILSPQSPVLWVTLMCLFAVLTLSASTFYVVAQREIKQHWVRCIFLVPLLMAVGTGISLGNALAVLQGLFGHQSEFVRTPKYGIDAGENRDAWKARAVKFKRKANWLAYVEILLALYLLICIGISIATERAMLCIPFLIIFMSGYLYVGFLSFHSQWLGNRPVVENIALPVAA